VDDVAARRPVLDGFYQLYLENHDAKGFVSRVSSRYCCVTLERLVSVGNRTTRRGAVLALGFLADYSSNAVLGQALVDRDRGVRTLAENSIHDLWCRVGSQGQRHTLRAVIRLNQAKRYQEAIRLATQLIHESPWIAESWCQRGTANYHLKLYDAAIRDCHQALEINPYHFTAAAGMGQCYLWQENPVAALEAFRRALRLNPNMEEVRAQVIQLQRSLQGEA
jgi:tetratricopeptide (TPR) repeat protein